MIFSFVLPFCFKAYKSEIVKFGVLKCREETPKLLQGTKFQERLFQIQDHRLFLMKDKKVSLLLINSFFSNSVKLQVKTNWKNWIFKKILTTIVQQTGKGVATQNYEDLYWNKKEVESAYEVR